MLIKQLRKFRARNFPGAKRGQVRRIHLAVDHAEILFHQPARQMRQRNLGGIGAAAEHRFAVEHPANDDAMRSIRLFVGAIADAALLGAASAQHTSGRDFGGDNAGAGLDNVEVVRKPRAARPVEVAAVEVAADDADDDTAEEATASSNP